MAALAFNKHQCTILVSVSVCVCVCVCLYVCVCGRSVLHACLRERALAKEKSVCVNVCAYVGVHDEFLECDV